MVQGVALDYHRTFYPKNFGFLSHNEASRSRSKKVFPY
ncbi:unnamed protein product [Amoebophrya sp. A25]|nr:unnamed protein product [Amoebophrya sp. A25]|eukprot:GSA25T00013294001.1